MSTIIDVKNTELEITSCCSCGCRFAVPEIIMTARRAHAGSIYCPNGHCLSWAKSDADKLRDQLQEAERKLTVAKCNEASERNLRETAERNLANAQRRTKHGVCPCCQRTFKQLAAHMKAKHPDFPTKGKK